MQLTQHFSLEEFILSQTATRKGINNTPNTQEIQNMAFLCSKILEPLRSAVGAIHISSGYRCKELNTAIGGALTSQHILGQAADITVPGMTNKTLYDYIKHSALPIDQCICEFPDEFGNPAWIHVSYSDRNRREFLRAKKVNGKTVYEKD